MQQDSGANLAAVRDDFVRALSALVDVLVEERLNKDSMPPAAARWRSAPPRAPETRWRSAPPRAPETGVSGAEPPTEPPSGVFTAESLRRVSPRYLSAVSVFLNEMFVRADAAAPPNTWLDVDELTQLYEQWAATKHADDKTRPLTMSKRTMRAALNALNLDSARRRGSHNCFALTLSGAPASSATTAAREHRAAPKKVLISSDDDTEDDDDDDDDSCIVPNGFVEYDTDATIPSDVEIAECAETALREAREAMTRPRKKARRVKPPPQRTLNGYIEDEAEDSLYTPKQKIFL